MPRLSLEDRIASYARVFPACQRSLWTAWTMEGDVARQWLYGHWAIGNDYTNRTRYYGAFPHSFLARVRALFPEIDEADVLHAFSGSLPPGGYTRIDVNATLEPEIVGNVYDIARLTTRRFKLVIVDPPYSAADAEEYGTPGVNRGRAMASLADVTEPGGHLAWLDTAWPMHRKADWHYYGAIALVRSTNHRVRQVSLFERKAAA